MITRVTFRSDVMNKFRRDLRAGLFTEEIRDLIEFWQTEIEEIGYDEYKRSDLFIMLNDHPLKKEQQGQRSISLDQKGARLIYTVDKNQILINVIRIAPDHDYS